MCVHAGWRSAFASRSLGFLFLLETFSKRDLLYAVTQDRNAEYVSTHVALAYAVRQGGRIGKQSAAVTASRSAQALFLLGVPNANGEGSGFELRENALYLSLSLLLSSCLLLSSSERRPLLIAGRCPSPDVS